MALTLYLHPLASFCHKVLIAFYESEVPFRAVTVDLQDPESAAPVRDAWPVGKIPLLRDEDAGRAVPESSIIIEYVQARRPGPASLLPQDPDARLQARLWDRFFDQYVSVPMQKIVLDRLHPENARDPQGVAAARQTLNTAYAMIDERARRHDWAAGNAFTLADCAAAPALFYAAIVHPFPPALDGLAAYFERLLARPSMRRVLREARPYFGIFPYRDAMPARFLQD
ncbi:glutathione S-transferase family protein [Achromobacter sp. Marseille-Q4962]|uniref:glutathione S-transferase family protein n=1 Tax=Achromobacter sp. Marseille-Q4962 TaxID=2942202 RepID=UPI00207416BB|nr:glutathione S-transferase family protein [Achromobacter sp. Marseille-Q4962]